MELYLYSAKCLYGVKRDNFTPFCGVNDTHNKGEYLVKFYYTFHPGEASFYVCPACRFYSYIKNTQHDLQ
jgi:hypothetical protein